MEATPAVNEDDRKLFVGGLPQEASDEDVKEYFGQYGEIENVNLKMDPQTGRSRGFAFIVFKDNDALNAASAQEAHVIKVNSILGQLLNKYRYRIGIYHGCGSSVAEPPLIWAAPAPDGQGPGADSGSDLLGSAPAPGKKRRLRLHTLKFFILSFQKVNYYYKSVLDHIYPSKLL